MTGEDLFFLIQGLNNISEKMSRIMSSDGFLYTNDYKLSGYDIESIANLVNKAERLISSASYEPVKKY